MNKFKYESAFPRVSDFEKIFVQNHQIGPGRNDKLRFLLFYCTASRNARNINSCGLATGEQQSAEVFDSSDDVATR